MARNNRWMTGALTVALVILLAVGAQCAPFEAYVENVEGVRIVHLGGTPREIGLQHGRLLKTEIVSLLDYFFNEKGSLFGISPNDLLRGAKSLKPHIPAEYMQEMEGIAEAAGVPLDRIIYANIFLDIASAGMVGAKLPLCSNFVALPGAAKGEIIHARNLDWPGDEFIVSMNTVFEITPAQGTPFVSAGWPGMVGTLTGMNSRGITMGEMTSMSTDATVDGMPIMMLLRKLLQESANLADAYSILDKGPRTTGYNVVVVDPAAKDAFIVEMSASKILRYAPQDGLLWRTNHYLDPSLKKTQRKPMAVIYGTGKTDTDYRYMRLEQLLNENRGNIDPTIAQIIMSDTFDLKTGTRGTATKNTVCRSNTLQSFVMLPQSRTIILASQALPSPSGPFITLQYNGSGKSMKP